MVSASPSPPPSSSSSSSLHPSSSHLPNPRSMRTHPPSKPRAATFSSSDSIDISGLLLSSTFPSNPSTHYNNHHFPDLSHAFSDCSSSDVSGELQRLAVCGSTIPTTPKLDNSFATSEAAEFEDEEPMEFLESMDAEELAPTVAHFVAALASPDPSVRRSAAGKIRLLSKNRQENRELLGRSGAIPPLVALLRSRDPTTQEFSATAILNLSLYPANRSLIAAAGAIKPLVHCLKTGTWTAKANSACALTSLAMAEENCNTIGSAGAIPALVSLLIGGTPRGKKDALTAMYKLMSAMRNKERAVTAGAVQPLLELISGRDTGVVEKAVVVLNCLVGIREGKAATVEGGGITVLVDIIEEGSEKGKELAVATLLSLCEENEWYRTLLVREGGIPPLVAISQTGTARAKHKAASLLRYIREPRQMNHHGDQDNTPRISANPT